MHKKIDFKSLTTQLEKSFGGVLPIDTARQQYFSKRKKRKSTFNRAEVKEAGVLAMLYPHLGSTYIAFMKRTEDGHAHSGQISFPGGRKELIDKDLVATALRETEEEFGIDRRLFRVIGSLEELYIPPSNSLVLPTVATLVERPIFVPNEEEVAFVIEVDLAELLDPSVVGEKLIQLANGSEFRAPYYLLHQKHILWGATALMVSDLLAMVECVDGDVFYC